MGFLDSMLSRKKTSTVTPRESESKPTSNAPTVAVEKLYPEFCGYKRIQEIFDLSRTHLHRLDKWGVIKSVSLRERGKLRGRRLYDIQSIRDYILGAMEGGLA